MRIDNPKVSGSLSFTTGNNTISGTTVLLSGSFSGSFFGDGSLLTGVTSYTNADTLAYINSLNVLSGSSGYTTDAELNASSSALITAYGNADNALSSSLATALTSEYVAADTALSSSLASAIATNTAKIGVTTETVRTAGALMDDEIDANIKTLSLPASTTISAFGKTLVDDADAATARTTLGVDAAGTDNSTDVTLTGAYDYITITGQTITRNQITNDDLAGSIANAKLANSSITINGSAVSLGGTRTLVTDDIAEDGSPVNLWYTDARVKTKLNAEGVISGSSQVNVSSTSGYQEPAIINNAGTPAFVAGITAAEVRTLLDVDPSGTDNSTDQNLFSTIAVAGQSSVVADTTSDTLTLAAGTNVSITTNATTDTITINSTDQYTGTVTSVGGTGTVNGLTLTGTVTTSGNLTLGGTLSNIANSALTNSSVSYGGVTLSLGGSDATPAFNLADATGLPIVAGTTGTLSVARGGTGATSAGTAATNLGLGTADNVSFASVSTTGNVTIGGDLTVLGSRTELQVTSLNVEDKNILIASGALDSAAADGAGITIGGANETITWDHANSRFSFSDDVHVGGNITVTGTVDGVDILALSNAVGGINTQVPAIYDNAGTPALNTGITEGEIKALLNLEIGIDVQAYNSTLAAVAGGTYSGDDSITTVGTIGTGTWQGTAIASAYLDADTMHLGVAQSITANKTFNDSVKAIFGTGGDMEIYHDGSNSVIKDAGTGVLELQTNGTEIQLTGASGVDYMARFINNGAVNLYHDNSLKLATAAGGVDVTGGITATGDIVAYYSSDRELKENIIPIENALEKVEALGGYEFDWNDKQDIYSGHDLGVIAQEVEAVLPELVQTRDNGYKAVKYEKLTAVLIQAVKELSARVKELESK